MYLLLIPIVILVAIYLGMTTLQEKVHKEEAQQHEQHIDNGAGSDSSRNSR
ncbi:hypothetical protein [Carnimonas bestiolae]|uniref:hypothetical protein n=1 Tax=Carnimonas bestiolae TaxID=3402172 RepID=UPI003EDC0BEB